MIAVVKAIINKIEEYFEGIDFCSLQVAPIFAKFRF